MFAFRKKFAALLVVASESEGALVGVGNGQGAGRTLGIVASGVCAGISGDHSKSRSLWGEVEVREVRVFFVSFTKHCRSFFFSAFCGDFPIELYTSLIGFVQSNLCHPAKGLCDDVVSAILPTRRCSTTKKNSKSQGAKTQHHIVTCSSSCRLTGNVPRTSSHSTL